MELPSSLDRVVRSSSISVVQPDRKSLSNPPGDGLSIPENFHVLVVEPPREGWSVSGVFHKAIGDPIADTLPPSNGI